MLALHEYISAINSGISRTVRDLESFARLLQVLLKYLEDGLLHPGALTILASLFVGVGQRHRQSVAQYIQATHVLARVVNAQLTSRLYALGARIIVRCSPRAIITTSFAFSGCTSKDSSTTSFALFGPSLDLFGSNTAAVVRVSMLLLGSRTRRI